MPQSKDPMRVMRERQLTDQATPVAIYGGDTLTMQLSGSNTVLDNRKTGLVAGVPQPLATVRAAAQSVLLRAPASNRAAVHVGQDQPVFPLNPGETLELRTDRLDRLSVSAAASGDTLAWIAELNQAVDAARSVRQAIDDPSGFPTGSANVDAELEADVAYSGASLNLCFRSVDNNNEYMVLLSAGNVTLRRVWAGIVTNRGVATGVLTPGSAYTIKARFIGTRIEVFVDGARLLAVANAVDFATATGWRAYGAGMADVTQLRVVDL